MADDTALQALREKRMAAKGLSTLLEMKESREVAVAKKYDYVMVVLRDMLGTMEAGVHTPTSNARQRQGLYDTLGKAMQELSEHETELRDTDHAIRQARHDLGDRPLDDLRQAFPEDRNLIDRVEGRQPDPGEVTPPETDPNSLTHSGPEGQAAKVESRPHGGTSKAKEK